MKDKIKKNLSMFLRFGLSGGLLWFIFSKIDMAHTIDVLKSADLTYIIAAGGVFSCIIGLLLYRWFIFIKALDLVVPAKDVVKGYFIGLFGNLFLPSAIGGDFLKVYMLCKNSQQKPRVVASAILDRLSGFASIVIVAVCSFTFGYRFIEDTSLLIPIVLMGVGSVGIVTFLFNEKIFSFGSQLFNKIPKFKKSLMNMHYDIRLMHAHHKEGMMAVGLSCLSQVILASSYYLVAKGLHQEIDLIYFLIFVPIICVASSFPSIGGLGVREAGSAYLFAKIGVDSGIAVSLTLINFFFVFMVGLIGGAINVPTLFNRRIQHDASASCDASV
ncbi:hypothetical protein MNBD_UNCLBAC01-1647 [hydrothermal vent metagenome]|uniref:Dolichol-P-glucose synthetase n=1 Tax=hydrothermal vent metagenome TaxID=652676 RepID=A0A3B1DRG5_9ZZZZ